MRRAPDEKGNRVVSGIVCDRRVFVVIAHDDPRFVITVYTEGRGR